MESVSMESIEKSLNSLNIGYKKFNKCAKSGFSRYIKFWIRGRRYNIEWWVNRSYLSIGDNIHDIRIPFRIMEICTTSPSNRISLVFADSHGQCETEIAVKLLDWQRRQILCG